MSELKNIKVFSLISILEGISYLTFALTMPLKYIWEIMWPNKVIGMAHGILFIIYMILAVVVCRENKWSFKRFIVFTIASLIPFVSFLNID
jgi:integral membrane protein